MGKLDVMLFCRIMCVYVCVCRGWGFCVVLGYGGFSFLDITGHNTMTLRERWVENFCLIQKKKIGVYIILKNTNISLYCDTKNYSMDKVITLVRILGTNAKFQFSVNYHFA